MFRVRLSVEEITFVELKYNNIPIGDSRPGKLLHRKWTYLTLGIYGGEGFARRCGESMKDRTAECAYDSFESEQE